MKKHFMKLMAAFLAMILMAAALPVEASAAGNLDGKLPDAGKFLGCNRGEDQDSSGTSWLHSYKFALDQNGVDASVEFLELLLTPGYNLELTDTTEADYISTGGCIFYGYIYTYTGNKKVGYNEGHHGEYQGNVRVSVYLNFEQNFIMLSYYFGDGFQVVDSGKHTSYKVTDLNVGSSGTSGGSSGSRGGFNPGNTVPCGVCNGSGKCTKCGGDGYLYSSASGKENRNCTHCHTHRGKCSSCGGDGWLN